MYSMRVGGEDPQNCSSHHFLQISLVTLCLTLICGLRALDFPGGTSSKEPANAEDSSSIPRSVRTPGEGSDNPLQYSCLENPMDRGAWRASVPRLVRTHTPTRTDRILVKQFFLDFLNIKTQVSITFLCFRFSIIIHYPKAPGWLYSPPLLWEFEKFPKINLQGLFIRQKISAGYLREKRTLDRWVDLTSMGI